MRKFYLAYRDSIKLAPLVQELSWTNNLLILEHTQNEQEREFYLKMTIKERWSKRELQRQLDTDLFTRYMSVKNPSKTLPTKSQDALVPFKPEYIGKMQFYLSALDEQIKLYHEKPFKQNYLTPNF